MVVPKYFNKLKEINKKVGAIVDNQKAQINTEKERTKKENDNTNLPTLKDSGVNNEDKDSSQELYEIKNNSDNDSSIKISDLDEKHMD